MMNRITRLVDPIHRIRRLFTRRLKKTNGVLLTAVGGLGDTVLFSLVAERFAALADPDEPITVMLRSDGAETAFCLRDTFNIMTVYFSQFTSSPIYRWKTLEILFQANYRLVVSTDFLRHPFLDEAMIEACDASDVIAMLARSSRKYDKHLNANKKIFTRLYDSGNAKMDKVIRWNNFASWALGKSKPPPKIILSKMFAPLTEEKAVHEVIIQSFSAAKEKQVTSACYKALINALPPDTSIRMTGLPSDLDANPGIKELIKLDGVTFDSSSFAEIAPRLETADLVVSVDTALMHLAVGLGAPTLCLASAAYVGEIVPYDKRICPDNVSFLFEDMPCAGCLGDCIHPLVSGRYACIDRITPERVVKKALDILHSSSKLKR